jgi:hypothetical protein
MSRYQKAIVYTRLGLGSDHLIEVGTHHPSTFTRYQFSEITKSGASSTGDKLRDMALYGLITKSGNTYKITENGHAIINGGSERSSAILAAINNVPLWAHLMKSIGKTPKKETFDKAIKEIPQYANLDAETLDNLWKAYNYDISCITKSPPFSDWRSAVHKFPPPITLKTSPHETEHVNNLSKSDTVVPHVDISPPKSGDSSVQIGSKEPYVKHSISHPSFEAKMTLSSEEYHILILDGIELVRIRKTLPACTFAEGIIQEIRAEISRKGGSK